MVGILERRRRFDAGHAVPRSLVVEISDVWTIRIVGIGDRHVEIDVISYIEACVSGRPGRVAQESEAEVDLGAAGGGAWR